MASMSTRIPVRSSTRTGVQTGIQSGPRAGANPGPRSGANPGPRSGANLGPRSGANPGPRSGANQGPRSGANQGPRAGARSGARPGIRCGLRRLSLASEDIHRSPSPNHAFRLRRRSLNTEAMTENAPLEGGVGNIVRRPSLTGEDDADQDFISQLKEDALLPLKEDLAEWMTKTLGVDISAESFMEALDTGVQVCRLAQIIQGRVEESCSKTQKSTQVLPNSRIKFKENAKAGTWFARDNTANFIQWCKAYGVKDECLFETEGLVLHRDSRSVVLCLLELARLGAKHGLEPPSLVKMEREIDSEEQQGRKHKPGGAASAGDSQSGAGKGQRKTSVSSSSSSSSSKAKDLDKEVVRISGQCNCEQCFKVNKVSEGKYSIGGKNVFVRLLKGKHVMVRVGGGWDTLDHYVMTHDPCRIIECRRNPCRGGGGDAHTFLYVNGKYKKSS